MEDCMIEEPCRACYRVYCICPPEEEPGCPDCGAPFDKPCVPGCQPQSDDLSEAEAGVIECPACGQNIKPGSLADHVAECRDLAGSGSMKSSFTPQLGGPMLGVSAKKPSLDSYDRNKANS